MGQRFSHILLLVFVGFLTAVVSTGNAAAQAAQTLGATERNLKVAFIGDSGYGSGAEDVLRLIKAEGADIVVHSGDMWYGGENDSDADKWNAMVNNILGPAYPYFSSVGNHDSGSWSHYQTLFQNRLNQIPEANCTGDLGVNSSCTYKGLFFILTGPGQKGSNHDT